MRKLSLSEVCRFNLVAVRKFQASVPAGADTLWEVMTSVLKRYQGRLPDFKKVLSEVYQAAVKALGRPLQEMEQRGLAQNLQQEMRRAVPAR